jgi:hypothetical protein
MADRQLTRRQGRPSLGGPYEGVPEHLRELLQHWVLVSRVVTLFTVEGAGQ